MDGRIEKVNLSREFVRLKERWSPRVAGELDGWQVKLVKAEGEFVWHRHEKEDEFFLVLGGCLSIHLRDRIVELDEGEFLIVPRGVEHKPVTSGEAHVLLFEPASTLNTGNVRNAFTVERPERIRDDRSRAPQSGRGDKDKGR